MRMLAAANMRTGRIDAPAILDYRRNGILVAAAYRKADRMLALKQTLPAMILWLFQRCRVSPSLEQQRNAFGVFRCCRPAVAAEPARSQTQWRRDKARKRRIGRSRGAGRQQKLHHLMVAILRRLMGSCA